MEDKDKNVKIMIALEKDDWDDLCKIMKTLTWGKNDISTIWWRMKKRVEKRMLERNS